MNKQHPKVKALREFNRWRRWLHDSQPNPETIGDLIEWAIHVCEAADKLVSAKGKHTEKAEARAAKAEETVALLKEMIAGRAVP